MELSPEDRRRIYEEEKARINVEEEARKAEESKEKPKGELAEKQFQGYSLYLDVSADDALKSEWEFRELVRRVQDLRKQKRLVPSDTVELSISCSDKAFLKKFAERLEEETDTKIAEKEGKKEKLLEREFFISL